MTFSRRSLLLAGAAGLGGALLGCSAPPAPAAVAAPAPGAPAGPRPIPAMPDVEREFGRRIGVHALDTGTGAAVGHRGGERFVMCSVAKALMAGFVLHRSVGDPALLDRTLRWDASEVLAYAPVTARTAVGATSRADTGLTVAQLCEAAVTVSDNTAHNVLLREVGSPADLTAWLRTTGDDVTRADRTEPALNDVDGDRDTSTPAAFTATLGRLTTGDALPPAQRDRLVGWLRANTTGDRQIRAGVPAGWQVGDKTGSGPRGEKNDAAILFPPDGAPVALTIFTLPSGPEDERGEEAVAAATRTAVAALRG